MSCGLPTSKHIACSQHKREKEHSCLHKVICMTIWKQAQENYKEHKCMVKVHTLREIIRYQLLGCTTWIICYQRTLLRAMVVRQSSTEFTYVYFYLPMHHQSKLAHLIDAFTHHKFIAQTNSISFPLIYPNQSCLLLLMNCKHFFLIFFISSSKSANQ